MRTYTDTERAQALAVLDANHGNVARTARETQIPRSTIHLWRDEARGLGDGAEWMKGASVASQGRPMRESRLLWEIRNWRYPDKQEGKAQRQDPNDDSADGADAIAALRYLVMSWWKAAKFEPVVEKRDRNQDYGFERQLARIARQQQQSWTYPW